MFWASSDNLIRLIYIFSTSPHLWTYDLEKFLIGQSCPRKSNAHLIHNPCLADSQMTKNSKKVYTYLVHNFGLAQS